MYTIMSQQKSGHCTGASVVMALLVAFRIESAFLALLRAALLVPVDLVGALLTLKEVALLRMPCYHLSLRQRNLDGQIGNDSLPISLSLISLPKGP